MTNLEDHEQIPTGEALSVCQKPLTPSLEHSWLTIEDLFDLVRPDSMARDMSNVALVPFKAGNAH